VAKATVSMVIRSKPGISEATRQRVLQVARELNYQPSPWRQTRGTVRHGQVALLLVTPDMPRVGRQPGGSYLHHLLDGCLAVAEPAGTSVVVCKMTLDQLESGRFANVIARRQFDGLLVRAPITSQLNSLLQDLNQPCVMVDCDRHVAQAAQVLIENLQAMDELAGHLLERGARRIAVITGDMDHLNAQERMAGLEMALRRRGVAVHADAVVQEHGFDEPSGFRGAQTLLQRGVRFDALVCHNDLIALGALRKLHDAGLRVPQDVRVTGFDDMEFSASLPAPLTTVDSHSEQLGQTATRLLLDTLASGPARAIHIRVPARLVVRAST
jgi:LacI family repressor for deo operon, udp, cdd, tsx, nupC, and nupG